MTRMEATREMVTPPNNTGVPSRFCILSQQLLEPTWSCRHACELRPHEANKATKLRALLSIFIGGNGAQVGFKPTTSNFQDSCSTNAHVQ